MSCKLFYHGILTQISKEKNNKVKKNSQTTFLNLYLLMSFNNSYTFKNFVIGIDMLIRMEYDIVLFS